MTLADRRGNPTDLEVKVLVQSDHRFNNHGGQQGGSGNGAFRGQNGQNRMTPVDLLYVLILLNEMFITVLLDTGAEKSFISEEVYRRYFSYRLR
ncbi:uncharacterized protein TNCV_4421521 [Trichonephila clavipes]|nr:uncharacterized protein TNCV_4421521 [Trichonephila clavipes]